ncbi:uncharacterized protein LOC110056776 [Orbicella faveolata]|uniref:uncharacterized protein LOC110056776 n=1 Tax=Orbicella faveolata TaxID=48498 RepID=UPI0009E41B6D|nr:uncharacterized protein LOC110056776 [Orbicella faveolata]
MMFKLKQQDLDLLALGTIVSRNKAQKLEVCIHKQNYIHSTWLKSYVRIDAQYCQYNSIISCGIRKKICSSLQGKTSNFEFEAKSSEDVKKILGKPCYSKI